MKVSTKGRYALRMMLDLCQHDKGEYISLKDVSIRQGITVKYLEQIATVLTKSGFLKSQRGNNGGYRLARSPREYTVGDILRVMEGSLAPITCLGGPENRCGRSAECAVLSFWEGLDQVINTYVDSVTLEDLAAKAGEPAGNDYNISF